jgi:hypothetical protein
VKYLKKRVVIDERSLRARVEAYVDKIDAFLVRGGADPRGPMFGAGASGAYTDVRNTLRALLDEGAR